MSLLKRLEDMIANSHATGYGSELPESVVNLIKEVAADVSNGGSIDLEKLKLDLAEAVRPQLQELVQAKLSELSEQVTRTLEQICKESGVVVSAMLADMVLLKAELETKLAAGAPLVVPPAGVAADSAAVLGAGDKVQGGEEQSQPAQS